MHLLDGVFISGLLLLRSNLSYGFSIRGSPPTRLRPPCKIVTTTALEANTGRGDSSLDKKSLSSQQQQEHDAKRRAVQQAFEELESEFRSKNKPSEPASTTAPAPWSDNESRCNNFDIVEDDVPINPKDWIDRTFDLLKDINRRSGGIYAHPFGTKHPMDFGRNDYISDEKIRRNEEILQRQNKWAKKIVDIAMELEKDLDFAATVQANNRSPQAATGTSTNAATGESKNASHTIYSNQDNTNENIMLPPSKILQNDVTAFRVEVELPGVKPEDIDIKVESASNNLVVTAVRRRQAHNASIDTITADHESRFAKRFTLDLDTIELDQITASLSTGILQVIAPKKPPKLDVGEVKKIRVVAADNGAKE